MNKADFIKEISGKLGYDEEKCSLISSVIEDHFIIGKNNKEKILTDLMQKVGINQEDADKIYNMAMSTLANGVKDKILHPFTKKD